MTGALRNPTLQRWLPVIVLPPVLLADGLLSEKGDPVDLLSVVFTYIAVLPLALWPRLGFFRMAPLLVGGVVLVLWDYEPGTTVVAIPAWALFQLARDYGRRETIIAAVAVAPCVLVSVLPFADNGEDLVSVTLRNLALCELALAGGYLVWHNRAALQREVATREAEAQRRLGEERLRIAREVHDVVAHSMVAINVQAGVAAHLLDRDTEQARDALMQIKRTSGDALDDLRATLGVLRDPDQGAPTGPAAGLADLDAVASQLRTSGMEVTVDVDTVAGVPTTVGSATYRIVQESLTNVLRHANAHAVSVVVRADQDMLTIVVADDGTGLAEPRPGSGAGLRGMRERAEALGGTLHAGPGEEGGWRVEATLPLTPVAAGS
ncbi:MAG TPA: sensor histidine kinase [Thermoleophilaceae bacterium]|nr:sensor histidine kinase [Thermoleophilaceae bacterium]